MKDVDSILADNFYWHAFEELTALGHLERATLWHLGGVPAATASTWLGHSAQEHLRTYAHAVLDRAEIDYSREGSTVR